MINRNCNSSLATLAILGATFLSAGCADDDRPLPVEPVAEATAGQLSPLPYPGGGLSGTLGVSDNLTLLVGPDGKTLQIDDTRYMIKVTIPKGALQQSATVTLALVDGEHVRFTATPGDLPILKPVQIVVQKLDQTTRRGYSAFRLFHRVGGQWVPVSTSATGTEVKATCSGLGEFTVAGVAADGQMIEPLRWLTGPGYKTVLIQASGGGTVTYDRYSVTIPRGALAADRFITVRDPGSPFLLCELEPHGIQFLVPVTLVMDTSGLPTTPYQDWTIWWYNESTGLWEDQGGTFNGSSIRGQLRHFSRYVAGRAGW